MEAVNEKVAYLIKSAIARTGHRGFDIAKQGQKSVVQDRHDASGWYSTPISALGCYSLLSSCYLYAYKKKASLDRNCSINVRKPYLARGSQPIVIAQITLMLSLLPFADPFLLPDALGFLHPLPFLG